MVRLMTALRTLRWVSAIEGLSYLLLVFVAMPLKHGFGWPTGVKLAGAGHGWLFVAFVAALVWAMAKQGWTSLRAAGLFGLSLIPFGFIAIERNLRKETERAHAAEDVSAETAPPSRP